MSKSLQACTTPSLLPCGRKGTARAVEDRELAGSLEHLAYSLPNMHCTANLLNLHANALCCTVLPITQTRRLSPTASGPPSFRERGLCGASSTAFSSCDKPTSTHYPKPPSMWKEGDRASGGGWRTRWLMRVPYMLAPKYALHRKRQRRK